METLRPIKISVRIGVDLGQKHDPTAICVAEVERRDYTMDIWNKPKGGVYHFVIRYLQRLPLGTSYPAVIERLVEIEQKLREDNKHIYLWADATGLGGPVIDLLDAAGLSVTPVYLTGTDKSVKEGRDLRLGKALLVSRLQVLLQSDRIHMEKTAEAEALVQELLNYEIRVSDDAHATFGAFKTGAHDDLATALGLAVWKEPQSISFGWG